LLLAWLVVGVPLGWGVYNTLLSSMNLFQAAPAKTAAPGALPNISANLRQDSFAVGGATSSRRKSAGPDWNVPASYKPTSGPEQLPVCP
jgi:hypothetical protein